MMGFEGSSVKKVEKIVVEKETIITSDTVASDTQDKPVEYAFVLDAFFKKEFDDQILDGNKSKEEREARAYVCLKLVWKNNTYLLPLRRDLGNIVENPKFSNVYYLVPSSKRPKAGLDFRKLIIVNDESLYRIDEARIASSQKKIIEDNYEDIKNQAIKYIKGFEKAAKKGRNKKDPLYKFSALNNFLDEF